MIWSYTANNHTLFNKHTVNSFLSTVRKMKNGQGGCRFDSLYIWECFGGLANANNDGEDFIAKRMYRNAL